MKPDHADNQGSRLRDIMLMASPPTTGVAKTAAEYTADAAVEMASATHALLGAVVLGMVSAKILDAAVLRTYLADLFKELTPAERGGAYGHSLSIMIASLGMAPSGTKRTADDALN